MMGSRSAITAALLMLGSAAFGNVYRVRNANDAGPGSLRRAIRDANRRAGRDRITFDPALAGVALIRVRTPLPAITDAQTVIDGDLDDDGDADIMILGELLEGADAHGLVVRANRCAIIGMAVGRCPMDGIRLESVRNCTIRSCHVGVNIPGSRAQNDRDIVLDDSHHNLIGGTTAADRNVICACNLTTGSCHGIWMRDSSDNVIAGNYFGVTPKFAAALGPYSPPTDGIVRHFGIRMWNLGGGCDRNRIGGLTEGERNVFGGLDAAVTLHGAADTVIRGNYFGLAGDGATSLPVGCYGIASSGSGTVVGGSEPGAGNLFAGAAETGVILAGSVAGSSIQGNWFGLNAAGTQVLPLSTGVHVVNLAEAVTIGGPTAAHGNYFCARAPSGPKRGIFFEQAGGGSVVRHNQFGLRPDGHLTGVINVGIRVGRVTVDILDNAFGASINGVQVTGADANPRVQRNTFRNCGAGVTLLNNCRCRLGNMAAKMGQGRNRFRPSNGFHIVNWTPRRVKAEGNSFGTTVRSEINQKIFDVRDDDRVGRVDFSPLRGGVLPTGQTTPLLAITSAAAVPTRAGGAEISFTLSAPAEVTVDVLNVAGRPVATVAHAQDTNAGTGRLVWSGQTDGGLGAPNGAYIVRIVAREPEGNQVLAAAPLNLRR